jgi:16S rRNA (adenine1518-N6/adenine1519-N6)-dimethyltransferase
VDTFVLDKILRAADVNENDCVLEIGPGIGAVTQVLAAHAFYVHAVELDKDLVPVLRALFSSMPVTIHQGDILKLDIAEIVRPHAGSPLKVVANLPYYVTTPVVMYLLESEPRFESITVMVQREVAERMAAKPNTKEYGALSLAVQYHAEISIAAYVPPNCFMPRPNVDSAVAHLKIRPAPAVNTDKDFLFKTIHAAFNQRRKTLVNALYANLKSFTKENITEAVINCGLPANIRGEALGMDDFAALANALAGIKTNSQKGEQP